MDVFFTPHKKNCYFTEQTMPQAKHLQTVALLVVGIAFVLFVSIIAKASKKNIEHKGLIQTPEETIEQKRLAKRTSLSERERDLIYKEALFSRKGNIARSVYNRDFIVGKLRMGEIVVGKKGDLLAKGSQNNVYLFDNYAAPDGQVDCFIFKLQKVIGANEIEIEQKMMNLVKSDYIASPLVATLHMDHPSCICGALQKREGKNLKELLYSRGRPSIEMVLEGICQAQHDMQERNVFDLDWKLANLVLSREGDKIKRIDLNGAFVKVPPSEFIYTVEKMPIEGIVWMRWIIDNQPYLRKQLQETVEKIVDFQIGLILYDYANQDPASFPYDRYSFEGERCYQFVTEVRAKNFFKRKFLKPKGWTQLSLKVKNAIEKKLDPSPFIEMRKNLFVKGIDLEEEKKKHHCVVS